ncbi:MAG: cytochrome c3 family protein [Acidobacteriota bacterium]|nr:cytochrome c3 family protein [Acidobacteriota bacterium]
MAGLAASGRWLRRLPAAGFLLVAASAWAQAPSSCLDCHSALEPPKKVTAEQFAQDIHAQKGLTCASCHGGDPTKDDDQAMSKAAGFRGKIKRSQVPELCASCHADAAYMHKYNPSLRTDQLAQYKTSVHGQRLAKGDEQVAVCTDCHSVHGIRPASDSRSSVHPLNVATTCSRCHSDAAKMKPYSIPTDQFAGYSVSVHHEAMVVRGDLSAPTCTTCHGNHGAAPPGVASVENVCANCHAFQAQLFDTSPHKAAFAAAKMPGCVTCHSNHRINHPTDALLGTGPQSVCTNCHAEGDAGFKVAGTTKGKISGLEVAIERADELLDRAERDGMDVSQAKLSQTQARDALTKARVSIHSVTVQRILQDVQAGSKLAEQNLAAGNQALADRDYRRWGLGVSVILILLTIAGLWLYIREIEGRNRSRPA